MRLQEIVNYLYECHGIIVSKIRCSELLSKYCLQKSQEYQIRLNDFAKYITEKEDTDLIYLDCSYDEEKGNDITYIQRYIAREYGYNLTLKIISNFIEQNPNLNDNEIIIFFRIPDNLYLNNLDIEDLNQLIITQSFSLLEQLIISTKNGWFYIFYMNNEKYKLNTYIENGIIYIDKWTNEEAINWINMDSTNFQKIKYKTKEICKYAVTKFRYNVEYIPGEFFDKEFIVDLMKINKTLSSRLCDYDNDEKLWIEILSDICYENIFEYCPRELFNKEFLYKVIENIFFNKILNKDLNLSFITNMKDQKDLEIIEYCKILLNELIDVYTNDKWQDAIS